jgi:hypothetical protein
MATSDAWGKLRPSGRVFDLRRLAEAASSAFDIQEISATAGGGLGRPPMD